MLKFLGIHLLSQHAEVVADLSVAENLLLPDYPRRGPFVDVRAMHAKARQLLERYDVPFAVDQPAGALNVGCDPEDFPTEAYINTCVLLSRSVSSSLCGASE